MNTVQYWENKTQFGSFVSPTSTLTGHNVQKSNPKHLVNNSWFTVTEGCRPQRSLPHHSQFSFYVMLQHLSSSASGKTRIPQRLFDSFTAVTYLHQTYPLSVQAEKKINNKSCEEWAERRDLQLLKRGNGFVRRRLHNRYMSTLSSLSLGWWFYVCSLYVSKNWLSWSMFFKICGDDEYSDVKNSWSSVIRLILKILLAQI